MAGDQAQLLQLCEDGCWGEAKDLIWRKSKLLHTTCSYGASPAYWAVSHDSVEMLEFLVKMVEHFYAKEHRAQVLSAMFETEDDDGETLFHVAASLGHLKCLCFLVKHSPYGVENLERRDEDDETPAHRADHAGNSDILAFIVRNAPSREGVLKRNAEAEDDNISM